KNYTDSSGLPFNRVYKVMRGKDGTVWIGTKSGACILKDGKIIPFKKNALLNKSSVFTLACDDAGNVWFGTLNNGALRYSPSSDSASGKQFMQFSSKNG